MDSTIQSCYNLSPQPDETKKLGRLLSGTKIGIEVEIENLELAPHIPGWRCIPDGSLRNSGVEYVFNGPLGGSGAERRLLNLEEGLQGLGSFGHRTSVHVHVDARDMLWSQVCDLVTLYAMVEPYLFTLCGKEREENIYSLSLYRGKQQISRLLDIFRIGPEMINESYWEKYSAINLLSLRSMGSLEFRGHHGTYDSDKLINWVNHLLALKEFVKNPDKSIKELPKMLSCSSSVEMLRYIFGDLIDNNMDSVAQCDMELYQGVWVAEDLLFYSKMKENEDLILSHNKGSNQMSKLRNKLCAD